MKLKILKLLEQIFIINKNKNFLSFMLIFTLIFVITNKNIIIKGIRIPICFPKN